VRAALRLTALGLVTAVIFTSWVLTRPLTLVSQKLGTRSHSFHMRLWGRAVVRILGIEVEVRGKPPEPPFFLVSNHVSYVDIGVLMSQLDGVFLAKSEIAGWPILGFLARSTGTLFIDRTRRTDLPRVIAQVRGVLDSGRGVVVFPEGTSTRGASVEPFKPSIFEVPIRTGTPVSHASVTYATPPGSPPAWLAVCWWGDMTFVKHFLDLLTLPGFRSIVTFGAEPVTAEDRKSLAAEAWRAVTDEFIPVAGSEA
jgi:1-acyl-sn-glycerol-3-phosphate acyltransferase